MSTERRTAYKFRPFDITKLTFDSIGSHNVFKYYGNKDDEQCMALGYPSPCDQNSLFVENYWKCNLNSGHRRMIENKNPEIPLENFTTILSGNMMIKINNYIYRDEVIRNAIYLGNFAEESKECEIQFKELEVYGDLPVQNNSEYAFIINGKHIYFIYYEFWINDLEVRRLDLSTRNWELLYKSGRENDEQEPSFLEKLIFYKDSIYIFGSKQNDINYGDFWPEPSRFMKIFMFDITEKKWVVIPINPECWPEYSDHPFEYYSYIQYPEKSNMVYMFGFSAGGIWRFDIDNLQFENFEWIKPKIDMIVLSIFATPSGRICWYGPTVTYTPDSIKEDDINNDNILCAWITIPKLKLIAWEAMIHYFKEPMLASSYEHLRKIGIPKEFCERFIEGRRINI